ncbi:MAG: BrnA antitoxin family protein [Aeromicrobium sp.]|nr:BrnA antitoxin family protein [Burkholderiales bacterium]
MRAEYDFSKAIRKPLIPIKSKTRISIFIDNAVRDAFRLKAENARVGYQTMMNEALKQFLAESSRPITYASLRQILKEVLPTPQKRPTTGVAGTAQKRAAR